MRRFPQLSTQAVENIGKACGQKVVVFRSRTAAHNSLWKSLSFTPTLYTICIQKSWATVDSFTSVMGRFYTVSTPLTKTTTLHKLILLGV